MPLGEKKKHVEGVLALGREKRDKTIYLIFSRKKKGVTHPGEGGEQYPFLSGILRTF